MISPPPTSLAIPPEVTHIEEDLHIFLWVLHGETVSSINNLYPVKHKFKSVTMYTSQFHTLDSKLLGSFNLNTYTPPYSVNPAPFETSPNLITGICPILPIHTEGDGTSIAYFPPMLFDIKLSDTQQPYDIDRTVPYSTVFGLYHIIAVQRLEIGVKKWIVKYNNRLFDHSMLATEGWGTNNHKTYSKLFKMIYDYAKDNGIPTTTSSLGIYACRDASTTYASRYLDSSISQLLPKKSSINMNNANAIIIDIYKPKIGFTLTILKLKYTASKLPKSWKALGGITYQGCGFNILAYYNLIKQREAREKIVCLPITGTTIFNLIHYISVFGPKEGKHYYVVYRFSLIPGLSRILESFVADREEDGTLTDRFIIFKIYNDFYQPGTDKLSQVGHIVSIRSESTRESTSLYFVDPQSEINYKIQPGVVFDLNLVYGRVVPWNYIDIIHLVVEDVPGLKYKVNPSTEEVPFLINPPPPINEIHSQIGLGKKNRMHKNKSRMHKNKSRMHKNKSRMHKNKSRRRRSKITRKNLIGGAIITGDRFIDLMNKIDEDENITSVLAKIEIKD